ncbi:class I SAM-dependent methyltransferase [Streptomyces lavendulae]|uniref:class I SAM-dependent methyltransferase n=1 Tax=Streptomyces lavendulae TaxID=1914 RepID=UPI003815476E
MTAPDTPGHYGGSLFSSAAPGENERLDALAAAFDPATRAHLRLLGIRQGWRCLELGGGTGSLAPWLTTAMGCALTVVDRDTTFLPPRPGMSVIEADITDPGFHPGTFDLVHARFLLMHLPDREAILRRLATWVRPGGLLVLADALEPDTPSPHLPYESTMTALKGVLARTIGSDHTWAAAYPARLTELGFQDVTAHTHQPLVGADPAFTTFVALTLSHAHDALLRHGLPLSRIKATLRHINRPGTQERFFSMYTVSARAPEV